MAVTEMPPQPNEYKFPFIMERCAECRWRLLLPDFACKMKLCCIFRDQKKHWFEKKKMHCAWCLMLVLCPSVIPAGNRAYLLSGSCLIVFLPEATCLLVGQLGAIFFEHQFWTGSGLLWQDPDADTVFLLQNVNTAPMPLGCTSGISMDHGFTWGAQPENPGIDPFFRRHW